MKKIFFVMALLCVGISVKGEVKEEVIRLEDTIINTEQGFNQNILELTKNVSVITSKEIEQKGARTVAEALKGVPNLIIRNMGGSDPKFDIRGQGETAFSNVIVLLDGIPLNSIDMSGYKTGQIPINTVERIEVIPSGGTILYGDGAVGGVINIITKSAKNAKNYGIVGLEVGSDSFLKTTLNYGTKLTNSTFLDLNFSKKKNKTFKVDSKDDLLAFDMRLKQLINNGYIEFKYSYSYSDFKFNGSILGKDEADKDPGQKGGWTVKGKNKYNTYNLNYNQELIKDLELFIVGEKRKQEYREDGYRYDTDIGYVRPQLKYSYYEKSYFILGGDFQDAKTTLLKSWSGTGKITKKSQGYFAINKFKISDFEFSQGYRKQKIKYDLKNEKKEFDENNFDLSINYLLNELSSVYISYNTAFRTPNTDELNLWDGEYKPQTSKTLELGMKSFIGDTYLQGAIFKTKTKNEIAYAKLNDMFASNRNLDGESERKGIEISVEHYFNKLILKGGIGYIDHGMKNGIYNGKWIPGVPKMTANILVSWLLNDQLTLNGDLNYNGKSYYMTDFNNTGEKLESYITVDTNLNYKYNEGLTLYVGINNIFDKKYYDYAMDEGTSLTPYGDYRSFYPAVGRNYYGGFKYSF